MQSASPRPGLLLGLIRARARCSPHGTSFGRSVQPRPPNSGGDGGPTYLRGGGFLPSRKCLGPPSPPTPLNGYTSTLLCSHLCRHGRSSIRLQAIHMGGFLPSRKCLGAPSPPTPLNGYPSMLLCRHPCRHGRSSIRLQAIHMHHCERLVSFPAHDDPSSIQYFGDEHRAEPWELQLRSTGLFQRYVVNPYQLSSLQRRPLQRRPLQRRRCNAAVATPPLQRRRCNAAAMQRRLLQSLTGVPVAALLSTRNLCPGHYAALGMLHIGPQSRILAS